MSTTLINGDLSTGSILAWNDSNKQFDILSPNAANGYVQLDSNGHIVGTIINRHGTAAEIAAITLADGEIATTSDTLRLFRGDGSTAGGQEIKQHPLLYKQTSIGNFTLTGTLADVDFLGGTDPVITIATAGTYLITTRIILLTSGDFSTTSGTSLRLDLRRTNNTAGYITGSICDFTVSPATDGTNYYSPANQHFHISTRPIVYTTPRTDDIITIRGQDNGGTDVGSIDVVEAAIFALRIG